ncbi:hypothetical protein NMR44_003671, partial [Vibrio cholerae]|nr:hypothetical protein [Vibrio cholerae]
EVIAEADITVNAISSLSLTLTPIQGLTVADIKKGPETKVANMNVNSTNPASNLALRMVNAQSDYPHCTLAVGANDSNNTAAFCLATTPGGDISSTPTFEQNGNKYYEVVSGATYLRSGAWNRDGYTNVQPDTYKVAVELVEFTL